MLLKPHPCLELDNSLQGLLSFERLDRASPDLWPEQSKFSCLRGFYT